MLSIQLIHYMSYANNAKNTTYPLASLSCGALFLCGKKARKKLLRRAVFLLDNWAEDQGWPCATLSFTTRWTRNPSLPPEFDFCHIPFLYSVLWHLNGVPFVNKKYTKGLPFLSKIVYNRDWTRGGALPRIKLLGTPHPPLPLRVETALSRRQDLQTEIKFP